MYSSVGVSAEDEVIEKKDSTIVEPNTANIDSARCLVIIIILLHLLDLQFHKINNKIYQRKFIPLF
jgi:hypothetical protein